MGETALLAGALEQALGGALPVGVRTWDGGSAGPDTGPTVVVNNRRASRRLLWRPGELGLARAYVTGDLDVDGDLKEGLRRCWVSVRARTLSRPPLGQVAGSRSGSAYSCAWWESADGGPVNVVWTTWSPCGRGTTGTSMTAPRRGVVDRDGRARRCGELPDLRRHPAPAT